MVKFFISIRIPGSKNATGNRIFYMVKFFISLKIHGSENAMKMAINLWCAFSS